jgi:hypothetical protein
MMNNKTFMNMDERNIQIAARVIVVMYLITIISLQVALTYRTLFLGQDINDIEDMAIITTINSLFLVAGLLYYGAIPIQRFSIKWILSGYVIFVLLGCVFTYVKYNVFLDSSLSVAELIDKFGIIAAVCGIIVLTWSLLAYLGKRKLDKELESD